MNEPASDVKREAQRPKNDQCDDDEPKNSSHDFLQPLAFGEPSVIVTQLRLRPTTIAIRL